MRFEPVIGLEIHIQLKTETKMFCGCSNEPDSYHPNSAVCPICMGHPGVLPVTNKKAITFAVKLAQSLDCAINSNSKFDRKHYFYPDLPKGYQISQYDEPLAEDGKVTFFSDSKKITICLERLHVEEDSAKMIHASGVGLSLIDFNRAGTPLVEIVTKPDFSSPQEARAFLQELRLLVRILGISDGDMEKGHLRCDANISLRPTQETYKTLCEVFPKFDYESRELWPKTEIKNINSFRSVEHALQFEITRQQALWEEGNPPMEQATRGWNDDVRETQEQRTKETLADYRYLPEPDLPRLSLDSKWIERITAELPELPHALRERFKTQYTMEHDTIEVFVEQPDVRSFFEAVVSEIKAWELASDKKHELSANEERDLTKLAASWIVSKLFEVLHKQEAVFDSMIMTAENFAELLYILYKDKISSTTAVQVLADMVETGQDPSHIINEKGLSQLDDEQELKKVIEKVIAAYPAQAEEYKKGKTTLLRFFVGQVMKETKGRAKPELAKDILDVFLR